LIIIDGLGIESDEEGKKYIKSNITWNNICVPNLEDENLNFSVSDNLYVEDGYRLPWDIF
jgi:hypothetical protein